MTMPAAQKVDLDFRLPKIAASAMKKWLVGLLLLPVLMLPSVGRSAEASPQGIHAAVLDEYLDQVEDGNGGLGSVSIFRGGREVYQRRFGQKYLPGVQADADTRYQIASVTKMVTAILAFKLIEQGRLGLDDTLADFHPEMPSAAQISVRQMLAHSSGLGNFAIKDGTVWIVDALEPPAILAEIRRQGVAFAPGTRVAYSNSAYYLLRMIVEDIYGRPYHEIVEQEIARPLHLAHFASVKANHADTFRSYAFADGAWGEIKEVDFNNVVGVGDIASTPSDLNRLIVALFNGELVRKETLALMAPEPGKGWGMGLAEFAYGENTFLGHGGDVIGAHSRVIYNPQDGTAIAYSTNGERIPTNAFLETIVGIVYDGTFQAPALK